MVDRILGIDIGGSGIKANIVDPDDGHLLEERFKVATPQPSTPDSVADVIHAVIENFDYEGIVGCTFPAIVKRGVIRSAANVDQSWMGKDIQRLFHERTGQKFRAVNDADAAGVAEMAFGAGRDVGGVVLLLTLGTGIGSGLFHDGVLVPNTEMGHIELEGHAPVEDWAAANVKKLEELSWQEWAARLDLLLHHLDRVLSPDLFVIGGGVSRRWSKYSQYITVGVETVPAVLENDAGIVGAAMFADGFQTRPDPALGSDQT